MIAPLEILQLEDQPELRFGTDGNETLRVSIIIACLDAEAVVGRCLDSIARQDYSNIEVIVADGGSTDGTLKILADCDWASPHSLRWFSRRDGGIADAWNSALACASGDWLLFIGADDALAAPDTISRAVDALKLTGANQRVVYGQVAMTAPDGKVLSFVDRPWCAANFRNCRFNLPHQAVFHHRSLFLDHGGFNTSYAIVSDFDFLLRELMLAEPRYISNLLVCYKQIGGISNSAQYAPQGVAEQIRLSRIHVGKVCVQLYLSLFKAWIKYALYLLGGDRLVMQIVGPLPSSPRGQRQAAIDKLTGAYDVRQAQANRLKRFRDEQQAALATQANMAGDAAAPASAHRRALFRGPLARRAKALVRRLVRPNLDKFEQYAPRPLKAIAAYRSKAALADLPTIAVVTPTLNQAGFLPAAIASIRDQGYPKLHYAVQDGGSNDGTLAILRTHGGTLDWESVPKMGQAEAINRGFERIEGEIMAWLNSDDLYTPGALAYVADYFRANPSVDMIYGNRVFINAAGLEVGRCLLPAHDSKALRFADFVPQETLFWRRRVWDAVGPIDPSFVYALDWDFILRAEQAGFRIRHIPRYLGCFRVHAAQKTTAILATGQAEMQRLRLRSCGRVLTRHEVADGIRSYLLRHLVIDRMHRLAWAGRRLVQRVD
jgi:glycosyltransferase involved in cell wall biosynthesis